MTSTGVWLTQGWGLHRGGAYTGAVLTDGAGLAQESGLTKWRDLHRGGAYTWNGSYAGAWLCSMGVACAGADLTQESEAMNGRGSRKRRGQNDNEGMEWSIHTHVETLQTSYLHHIVGCLGHNLHHI